MNPRYRDVKSGQIPGGVTGQGREGQNHLRPGEGVKGPVQDIVTDPEYLDVPFPPVCF